MTQGGDASERFGQSEVFGAVAAASKPYDTPIGDRPDAQPTISRYLKELRT